MPNKESVFPKLTEDSASNTLYALLNMAIEDKATHVWINMETELVGDIEPLDLHKPKEVIKQLNQKRYSKDNVQVHSVGLHYMVNSVLYEISPGQYFLGRIKMSCYLLQRKFKVDLKTGLCLVI